MLQVLLMVYDDGPQDLDPVPGTRTPALPGLNRQTVVETCKRNDDDGDGARSPTVEDGEVLQKCPKKTRQKMMENAGKVKVFQKKILNKIKTNS